MVQFKCIHTGNVYTFNSESDINEMRKHSEYQEVTKQEEVKEEKEEQPVKVARKPKGQ